jgi:hypothetical protein
MDYYSTADCAVLQLLNYTHVSAALALNLLLSPTSSSSSAHLTPSLYAPETLQYCVRQCLLRSLFHQEKLELEIWSFETPPRVFVWDAMAPRLSFHEMRDATSATFYMGHPPE